MSYADDWTALSARISGLSKSVELELLARSSKVSSDLVGRYLLSKCNDIVNAIEKFRDDHSNSIGPTAEKILSEFLDKDGASNVIRKGVNSATSSSRASVVVIAGVVLTDFQSELSYLLSNNQQTIRSQTELAFSHLQRSLAVDPDVRSKWSCAFKEREDSCEKLGALHLLLFGIHAFKAHALGGRTDLIFNDQISKEIVPGAQGLVLTEWKLAKEDDDPTKKIDAAMVQAELYSQGVLSGIELKQVRYLVVVSKKSIKLPDDRKKNEVVYRHINVAIDPDNPSVQAIQSTSN